ncbi:hypothetical protein MRB53_040542 [Persea americana]|nr:hypothetical protein MRB53_040542 [Persea americana]
MLLLAVAVSLLATSRAQTIDLGYSKVSAYQTFNSITSWVNIRYAAPPVGNLRFAAPEAPLQENSVNDGKTGYTCRMSHQDLSNDSTSRAAEWND